MTIVVDIVTNTNTIIFSPYNPFTCTQLVTSYSMQPPCLLRFCGYRSYGVRGIVRRSNDAAPERQISSDPRFRDFDKSE